MEKYIGTMKTIMHHCTNNIFVLNTRVEFERHSWTIEAMLSDQNGRIDVTANILADEYRRIGFPNIPIHAVSVNKRCFFCDPEVSSLKKLCQAQVLRSSLAHIWHEVTKHRTFDRWWISSAGTLMFTMQLLVVNKTMSFLNLYAHVLPKSIIAELRSRQDMLKRITDTLGRTVKDRHKARRNQKIKNIMKMAEMLEANKVLLSATIRQVFGYRGETI